MVPETTFEFEFVASNLTSAVTRQMAHFIIDNQVIVPMVEITKSTAYYVVFFEY